MPQGGGHFYGGAQWATQDAKSAIYDAGVPYWGMYLTKMRLGYSYSGNVMASVRAVKKDSVLIYC